VNGLREGLPTNRESGPERGRGAAAPGRRSGVAKRVHNIGQQGFKARFRNVWHSPCTVNPKADVHRTEVNALQCKYVSMRVGGAECYSCQKSCVSCASLHRKRWIPKSSLL